MVPGREVNGYHPLYPHSTTLGPSRVHAPSLGLGIGDPIPLPSPVVKLHRDVLISALVVIHLYAIVLPHKRLFVSSESELGVRFGIIFCRLFLVLCCIRLRASP